VDNAGDAVAGSEKYWTPDTAAWYQRNWYAGVADPVIDPAYFDPLLTNPCPPILARELDAYQLHSKTPKRKIAVAEPVKVKQSTDTAPPSGEPGSGAPPRPSARSPLAGGAGGYGASMNPYASGGEDYAGSSYGGAGGYGAGGYGGESYGAGGYGGESYGGESYGAGGYGGESYGAGGYGEEGAGSGGYGSGGYGMGGGAPRVAAPTVDYKLFRFYDFMVESGKRYKYRVKLYLRDPNHPQPPVIAPAAAHLEDTVVDRIKELEADTFWRATEWSEWSPPGKIPNQYQVAAGPATPERATPVDRDRGIDVAEPGSEPEASVLALVFDQAKAADVPALLPAVRGSVLNFKTKANVLHPLSMQVFPLPDYEVRTGVVVLDLRGGQQLPTTDRANIDHKAPGEVLLMDSDGRLVVRNELDDILEYTNNIFKEPEKPKAPPTTEEASDGYGYPGMSGPGKAKRPRGGA
jgi:hypothetical protein